MPALAVADALRRRGADVSFVGVGHRTGSDLIAANGYAEDRVPLRGLTRRITIRNVWALLLAAVAMPRALMLLRRRRADVVIAAGSYVGGPVALAAWLARRPLILTEADSHLGLANRLAAPFAKRVALAFPIAGRRGRRYVVTGRPVSDEVRHATRTAGRRAFGIAPDATCVLVSGGSQGAATLNAAAVDAFRGQPPFDVIHLAGASHVEAIRDALPDPHRRYHLFGYIPNMHDAIAAADLVVSRSGGSVSEIAAIGRPAILVPYPFATGDHQTKNAQWLAEAGAAIVVRDDACTGSALRDLVGALLSDPLALSEMGRAAHAMGRPDAADRIADLAYSIARP